ncbi:hypothetical protein GALL_295550 [mine drainage metagenome]|jgi:hypothetical protein|uniref:Uncharacterized protein n=1 Tax=mine drainage metagenome TaxID=410659 RepID=A0A1J5QYA3_9ZZZZ
MVRQVHRHGAVVAATRLRNGEFAVTENSRAWHGFC